MSRTPLVICGLTRFAEMVAHYFDTFSDYEVVAFAAHERFVKAPQFRSRPLVPIERLAAEFAPASTHFFAAVEYKWLNAARAQIVAELQALGFAPASFIHPKSSVCPTANLGPHCLVMEGAVLSYDSAIGSDNVLFPQTFIGQSARLGSHNYVCPRVTIDRYAAVEDHCYLGTGTTVAESGKIGSWCYTRPQQQIVDPIPTGSTFNPALRAPGYVIDRRPKPAPAASVS